MNRMVTHNIYLLIIISNSEQVASVDHLALGSMKNAVNCVNKYELQI